MAKSDKLKAMSDNDLVDATILLIAEVIVRHKQVELYKRTVELRLECKLKGNIK